ncbi:YaaL family protein [Anaerolentibacter hominis]|uniref:YaaL family protein n=1 Tax=Anaerolentibacter hominis TaxID=3079009 RepID=UPI0031B81420
MGLFRKREITAKDTLIDEIEQTKRALTIAYSNFENVSDPDLIDCYIYEVNAVQKRYKYLLRIAENRYAGQNQGS